jgi:hypothetical protein
MKRKRLCTQRPNWNRWGVVQSVYGFDRETIVEIFYAVHEEPDERELERWEDTIVAKARQINRFVPKPRSGRFTRPKYEVLSDRTVCRNWLRLKKRKESGLL